MPVVSKADDVPAVSLDKTQPPPAATLSPVESKGATHVVLHELVGSFPQGSKIKVSDLGKDADIDRLISLGAIAPIAAELVPSK